MKRTIDNPALERSSDCALPGFLTKVMVCAVLSGRQGRKDA